MEIQDLGAIGEFISSIIIVITLMVLVYEVRGSKRATLQSNAQERQRKRDDMLRSLAESPDLATILVTANQHIEKSLAVDIASEFGLNLDQFLRLNANYSRTINQLSDAHASDLSDEEQQRLLADCRRYFSVPAVAKWYDLMGAERQYGPDEFHKYLDDIRKTV